MCKKFQVVLDNNVYCSKIADLEFFKEKYKYKIKIMLTDPNISEMIEFPDRLKIALKIKDKLFGPPAFAVLTELNSYFNRFNFIEYFKMKQLLFDKFFRSGVSFKELIETGDIFHLEQVQNIRATREKIKKMYEGDWQKSKSVINPIIEKIMKEEGLKKSTIINDVIKNYFLNEMTFDLVMERFRIKEFFPKYIKLYSNNVWFNNIKTISTFLKFYMEKMERYTKQNFTNVVGADLLDLDYTVYFPYIDFFVTENEKHFLYGIDDMKVKTFDEFKKLLNK